MQQVEQRVETGRWPEIDCLRILSASALFYWHVGLSAGWPLAVFSSWATGVFVTTSAFCAVRFSRHRKGLQHGSPGAAQRFLADRFLAVYPAYTIITLLIFAGSFVHPATGHAGPFSVTELGVNLLMLNPYVGVEFFSAPMWFIPFIFQVYLLIPLFCRYHRWPIWGMAASTVLSVFSCWLAYRVAPRQAAEICRTWSPMFRLTPVFFGVALGTLSSASLLPRIVAAFAVCALGELAVVPVFPEMANTLRRPMQGFVALIVLGLAACLLARAIKHAPSLQWWATLLGQASFPFFITHAVMISFLWAHFRDNTILWLGYFVLCWVGSGIFALFYRSGIERLRSIVIA
jgi:peptidoglycan/LPS O-acetylase OafA/YrhL